MIEFRCTRCWQSNFAKCELTGNPIACRKCGQETTVPEATPERIARAQAMLQEEVPDINPYASTPMNRDLSEREIIALAEMETRVPLREINFSGYSLASLWARLFAQIIDGVLFAMTLIAGIVTVLFLIKQGYIEKNGTDWKTLTILPVAFSLPTLLILTQWTLLANHGQTIGKKLLMIRVVTMNGKLPGFIRGVFLRNWMRVALSFIPFFALIDLLFGLGASRRCIHDLISGTRVVETN
jgi:uncharacterized RDD family membrane protein YckC